MIPGGPDVVLVDERVHNDVPIAVLTLNRPDLMNPVDEATIAALEHHIGRINREARNRALVITGAGPAFSAGGDLKGYQALFRDRDRFERFVEAFGRVCKLLERSDILTVAMVNGTCLAGGMEIALSCDLITLADTATIGDGHMRFSMMPGSGCQRLVRAVGVQRARHLLLSGDLVPASVAVDIGLAIAAVPPADLAGYTLDEVTRLCQASPVALARLKGLIVTALTTPLDDGLAVEERTAIAYATGTNDAREGLMAFAEKRPPVYTGT